MSAFALSTVVLRRAPAEPTAPARPTIDFSRQIRPILSENCFACHGPDDKQRKAGLRLDTKQGAFAELKDGGFAIVPGKAKESELFLRLTATDSSQMPPAKSNKKLKPEQIDLLRQWIEQGAKWSEHWAFVAPTKPVPRNPKGNVQRRNEIDDFVFARLEHAGLSPAPEAERATLVRRVTLDLTGLPPTIEELERALNDPSPDWYEKVVDRLLNSPRYGEHMARYWLDVARYGDTHGLHLDNYREIWPWRDWVIKAFNTNMPYDRFVIEQLAGDLLPNPSLDQVVATGFNRCHVTTNEGGAIEEEVYVRNVFDRVETSATAFMGLTFTCCRCHDHKFDPATMKDFYGLFAFFNSLDGREMDGNAARHPPVLRVATGEQLEKLERINRKTAALQKMSAEALAQVKYEDPGEKAGPTESLAGWQKAPSKPGALPKAIQDILKRDPSRRSGEQAQQLREYFLKNVYSKTREQFAPLNREVAAVEQQRDQLDKQLPATLVFKEAAKPRQAYLLKRGEYDQRGEPVGRNTPAFLPPLPDKAPRNRLGLAQWLVAPNHPLTARVAVNRFWQQLFGTGLVKTTEDFGSQGEPPTHPELLDWLAVEFMAENPQSAIRNPQSTAWDVKRLMRLMVTSATYRQSAKVTPERLAKDPHNRLLSRGPRYRLDAEMLRDQALFVSGLLVEKLGGPSVKPPQPSGLWEAVGYTSSNTAKFAPDTGADRVHRRSLYIFWKRTAAPPQMTAFDAPSREACTVRRERTNTPLQALLLLNEVQYVEAARALAERTLKHGGQDPGERLEYMFRLATARKPDRNELAELLAVYNAHLAKYGKDLEAAKKLIAVGETRPDEKLNPSELAAWTMVANLILNLDEVISKG